MKTRIAVAALLCCTAYAKAGVCITEYMYQGLNGATQVNFEFIELTNLGAAGVDVAGWSFDDNTRVAGSTSLSALGTIAPGESVVLTEALEGDFRARWNLGASVRILGGNANNLGRSDEINIYDASISLVDRLTFGDQDFAGTVRANGKSAWRYRSDGSGPYGTIDATWVLSSVGDAQGSVSAVAPGTDIASPGHYNVPAPTSLGVIGAAFLAGARRRRS